MNVVKMQCKTVRHVQLNVSFGELLRNQVRCQAAQALRLWLMGYAGYDSTSSYRYLSPGSYLIND